MLIKEAIWIGDNLSLLHLKTNSIVLNFGSQTNKFNKNNTHIINYVIRPIDESSILKSLDLKKVTGIDFSGNLYDDDFFNKMKGFHFDCILLCNVLEHVTDIEELCKRISGLLKKDGILIFTGPKDYPLHYDPIDNGFRPEVSQVQNLFNDFEIVKGEIITDYSYKYYLLNNPIVFIITIIRTLAFFYKFKKWKKVVLPKFKWWNRDYKATCIIFKKK